MRLKSIRTKLIISGIYVLLLGTLLVSMSLGRYQETRVAYASFGAATFNTVILGDNTITEVQTQVYDEYGAPLYDIDDNPITEGTGEYQWNETGVANEFGIGINTANYMPGMTWNENESLSTAEEFPFAIANGRNLEYVSDASVEYYIRLRTLKSLPLEYMLTHTYYDAYEGQSKTDYFITTEPERIEIEETGDVWYEYSFYTTVDDEAETENLSEVLFGIDGGTLGMNEHSLILEWPSDDDANDIKYMKELETLQIIVTTSSKNMLTEDDYIGNVDTDTTYEPNGIIILDPSTGDEIESGTTLYTYEIDYRSFATDDTQKSLLITVDNGVRPDGSGGNNGIEHSANRSNYTVWLKVPYVAKDYGYVFYETIGSESTATFQIFEYRVYDVKTDTYTSYTTDPYNDLSDDQKDDLYVIYRLMDADESVTQITMYYATTTANITTPSYNVKNHKLVMTEAPSDSTLSSIAFSNKLELWLENTYYTSTTTTTSTTTDD